MKIGISDFFKVLNEIYMIRRMNIAERVLVRPKKDLINYIAIHFWSIVKTLLVFLILLTLVQRPDLIPFRIIYVFIILGFTILIFDSIGSKAIILLISKFFISLFSFHKNIYKESIKYFSKSSGLIKEKKCLTKIFYWILFIVFFIALFSILYIINLIILLGVYTIIFSIVIFLNNETLSLMISYAFCKTMISFITIDYINYFLYIISLVFIYISIDIRVKLTNESLVLEQSIESGVSLVIGMEVLSTHENLSIFQKDKKFYVLDNNDNSVKVYTVKSKFGDIKNDIENKIKKKKENDLSKISRDNNDNIST